MGARSKAFAPERHLVRTTVTAPLVPRDADDYVLRHEGRLLSRAGSGKEERLVATVRWDLLRLALARDERADLSRVVGGDPELGHAVVAGGAAAGSFPQAAGFGDVLYFRSIEVEPRGDAARVARALVEHVLRFHSGGSRAAAFVFGRGDPPAVREAFQAAGFALVMRLRNMEFYALALPRPRAARAERQGEAGAGRRSPGARRKSR
jgi:hypothetical protein